MFFYYYLEFTSSGSCFLLIPASQDDSSASAGQIEGRLLADPGVGSRHDDRLPRQLVGARAHAEREPQVSFEAGEQRAEHQSDLNQ